MENGLTEDKINHLDDDSAEFTAREQSALLFAEKLATDHQSLDDAFFKDLRHQFTDPEIMELGMMIGQYIGFGRLLQVLDLEPDNCPI
jgi:alkylhydroperoxidase family enzyme